MKNFLNNKKWLGLLALAPYVPLEPLPGASTNTYNSLSAYLNLVFNILLSIGGMIAVVTLVLGGITYMVSEIVDRKAEAKRRMQAAIWGLLLLLSCWLILHEINPNLTQFSLGALDNQGAQPAASTPASGAPAAPATAAGTPTDTTQLNAQLQNCNGAVNPNPTTGTPSCTTTI